MTTKNDNGLDHQFLLNFLSTYKEEGINSNVIQNKIKKMFQDLVNLYDNEQKNVFYRWIEKGNEQQLNSLLTFKCLLKSQLINTKLHDIFDLPDEIVIPEDVTTKISTQMIEIFKKKFTKKKKCNVIIPLDEENSWNDNKNIKYLEHIKKGILLCDDQNTQLTDHLIYTETDYKDNPSEEVRKMMEGETFTEEEIYNKSLGISNNNNNTNDKNNNKKM